MPRIRLALLSCATIFCTAVISSDPPASPAVAAAIAEARSHLESNQPARAVAALEKVLAVADGNREYLEQLRKAYAAELASQQQTNGDPRRVEDLKTKLALLGGTVDTPPPPPLPSPIAPPTPPGATPQPDKETVDLLNQAATLFNEAKAELQGRPNGEPRQFGLAARLFALAFAKKVEMTPDQMAAWAYCRVRLAADQLNRSGSDPAVASQVITEVEEALALAPSNDGLQKVGADVIAAARRRGGSSRPSAPAAKGGAVIETASFRVAYTGNRDLAEAVARAAEQHRGQIFARWSGPPSGDWSPKCDIVLHPDASAFAAVTRQPAAATGRALVRLSDGRPVERRIDLRADDNSLTTDALPRELSHVVIADLFADKAPPKWAEVGMAILASSPTEVSRYRQTLSRCARSGELIPVERLFTLNTAPTENVTGFYVESVCLVDFLVRWKGEKAFTGFLRDAQRYGLPSAMKRQYGISDAGQLESAWKQSELTTARGQGME